VTRVFRGRRGGAVGFALSALCCVDIGVLVTTLVRRCLLHWSGFDVSATSSFACRTHFFLVHFFISAIFFVKVLSATDLILSSQVFGLFFLVLSVLLLERFFSLLVVFITYFLVGLFLPRPPLQPTVVFDRRHSVGRPSCHRVAFHPRCRSVWTSTHGCRLDVGARRPVCRQSSLLLDSSARRGVVAGR